MVFFVLRSLLQKSGRFKKLEFRTDALYDLLFFILIGVILGGRLGYVLFYNFGYYLQDPFAILKVWEGGMSFHGGLIGSIIAILLFCINRQKTLYDITDLLAIATPIGLGLGRLGNFINAELYGRITDVPWCMQFPTALGCRHPSQLYEFLLEGVLLFIILWWMKERRYPKGFLSYTFVAFYGLFRFMVEFFREPDEHLGFLLEWVTMGQILSIPMILLGVWGMWHVSKNKTMKQ